MESPGREWSGPSSSSPILGTSSIATRVLSRRDEAHMLKQLCRFGRAFGDNKSALLPEPAQDFLRRDRQVVDAHAGGRRRWRCRWRRGPAQRCLHPGREARPRNSGPWRVRCRRRRAATSLADPSSGWPQAIVRGFPRSPGRSSPGVQDARTRGKDRMPLLLCAVSSHRSDRA